MKKSLIEQKSFVFFDPEVIIMIVGWENALLLKGRVGVGW